jgi:hypothetical protein
MRSSGFSHSHFAAPHSDPVRAAEEDIRSYLVRRGVIAPRQSRPGRPSLCFLAVYGAIGLIVFLGSLWLARMECDPMFMDRGLTVACRNRAGASARIVGPAGNSIPGFLPSTILQ